MPKRLLLKAFMPLKAAQKRGRAKSGSPPSFNLKSKKASVELARLNIKTKPKKNQRRAGIFLAAAKEKFFFSMETFPTSSTRNKKIILNCPGNIHKRKALDKAPATAPQ